MRRRSALVASNQEPGAAEAHVVLLGGAEVPGLRGPVGLRAVGELGGGGGGGGHGVVLPAGKRRNSLERLQRQDVPGPDRITPLTCEDPRSRTRPGPSPEPESPPVESRRPRSRCTRVGHTQPGRDHPEGSPSPRSFRASSRRAPRRRSPPPAGTAAAGTGPPQSAPPPRTAPSAWPQPGWAVADHRGGIAARGLADLQHGHGAAPRAAPDSGTTSCGTILAATSDPPELARHRPHVQRTRSGRHTTTTARGPESRSAGLAVRVAGTRHGSRAAVLAALANEHGTPHAKAARSARVGGTSLTPASPGALRGKASPTQVFRVSLTPELADWSRCVEPALGVHQSGLYRFMLGV